MSLADLEAAAAAAVQAVTDAKTQLSTARGAYVAAVENLRTAHLQLLSATDIPATDAAIAAAADALAQARQDLLDVRSALGV